MQMTDAIRPLNAMTAAEVLAEEGEFSNFIRALELSGVGDMLEKKGPYTVFAPMDDVFNKYTMGGPVGSAKLDDLLWHFIVPGKYTYEGLHRLKTLKTVGGYMLMIEANDGIMVNGMALVKPDLPYNKGIIHGITKAGRP